MSARGKPQGSGDHELITLLGEIRSSPCLLAPSTCAARGVHRAAAASASHAALGWCLFSRGIAQAPARSAHRILSDPPERSHNTHSSMEGLGQ